MTEKQIQAMIAKAIGTSDLSAGGVLGVQQARYFIEEVFDTTPFLQAVRTEIMTDTREEFDKIGVGQRQLKGRVESDATHANYMRTPTFGKLELTALDYGLPFGFTKKVLRDNVEAQKFEGRVVSLFTRQTGIDTEDVAINGNTVYSGAAPATTVDMAAGVHATNDPVDIIVADVTGFPRDGTSGYLQIESEDLMYEYADASTNTFLNCARAQRGTSKAAHVDTTAVAWDRDILIGKDDGWLKKLYDGDSVYEDLSLIGSGDLIKDHFFKLHRNMPRKWRNAQRGKLRWMMSDYQESVWLEYLTNRGTAAGDRALEGDNGRGPLGIPILSGAKWPDDVMALGDPQNFILGMRENVEINKTGEGKDALYLREIYYDIFVSMDFEVEQTAAVSFGDGLTTS